MSGKMRNPFVRLLSHGVRASRRGFTFVEIITVIALITIIVGIALPSFLSIRTKAYNRKAMGMAREAGLAQETYKMINGGNIGGHYADELAQLLSVHDDLLEDDLVTFSFGDVNSSGYTMFIRHQNGDNSYLVSDDHVPAP
ncbi:MAG: type II secretion system GspH family protein [Deltaproteobacteria bacterium]|nr:type II secretion system GspH family protein [Deltaproteobacteria bacterium]